jgi:hypothetical protein
MEIVHNKKNLEKIPTNRLQVFLLWVYLRTIQTENTDRRLGGLVKNEPSISLKTNIAKREFDEIQQTFMMVTACWRKRKIIAGHF